MNNIQVTRFIDDEIEAREAEDKVLRILQKKYPKTVKVPGNHPEFDLEVPEIKKTVEIKWDKRSDETGNYFVETSFNGEPSGIESSTADWWCFVDKNSICFIPRESLKYLLRTRFCFLRVITGGDGTKVGYRFIKKDILQASPYAKFIYLDRV